MSATRSPDIAGTPAGKREIGRETDRPTYRKRQPYRQTNRQRQT